MMAKPNGPPRHDRDNDVMVEGKKAKRRSTVSSRTAKRPAYELPSKEKAETSKEKAGSAVFRSWAMPDEAD